MEARRPPPFVIAISASVAASMASVTSTPMAHSPERQEVRSPSITAALSPITTVFISSMGSFSSAMRAAMAASGATEASIRIGSPMAEVTSPASSNTTVTSPRNLP
jgi:hypothetical protein